MSTWGGIGEGLTAGMNARIALEEQRRKDRQAQANADRAFGFQKEQAKRAQENADRAYEARRADAANAQANTDRAFAEGVRRADMAQANADRAFGLKADASALERELSVARDARAERELSLREQDQSWADRLNEEKLNSFRLANEKLDRENENARRIDDERKASGRQQLAMAFYRVTGGGGEAKDIGYVDANGRQQTIRARVLPQGEAATIFGKDGFFKDVQNVVAFEDENGDTITALVRPDGTMQMFTPDQQYDVYSGGFGAEFAKDMIPSVSSKRDLGLFTKKEEAKANAAERARSASDPYGKKRQIDAAVAILKADDASESDRMNALEYLGSVFGVKRDVGVDDPFKGEWTGFSTEKVEYLKSHGYVWDAKAGKPVKRKIGYRGAIVK